MVLLCFVFREEGGTGLAVLWALESFLKAVALSTFPVPFPGSPFHQPS